MEILGFKLLYWIILLILLIASGLDLKKRSIPSFFLTAMIFVVALVSFHLTSIYVFGYGIMAFIFGWLLYDLNFFGGIADVKAVTLIGFLIPNIKFLFIFIVITLIYCFAFQLLWKFALKKDELDAPFVVPITATYVALMFLGGLV
jgi:hypothetical protein